MGHSTGRTRLDTTISCPAEFRINRLNVVNDVHQHQQLTIQSAIRTLLLRGWQALQFCTGMAWELGPSCGHVCFSSLHSAVLFCTGLAMIAGSGRVIQWIALQNIWRTCWMCLEFPSGWDGMHGQVDGCLMTSSDDDARRHTWTHEATYCERFWVGLGTD